MLISENAYVYSTMNIVDNLMKKECPMDFEASRARLSGIVKSTRHLKAMRVSNASSPAQKGRSLWRNQQ